MIMNERTKKGGKVVLEKGVLPFLIKEDQTLLKDEVNNIIDNVSKQIVQIMQLKPQMCIYIPIPV